MTEADASRPAITWHIRRFDTIDSTNRFVLDEARAGAEEGLVAVADHQHAGRGRRGRLWTAPPGSSLLVSVLLRPQIGAEQAHLMTMAAACALAEAVARVAGFAPALKWPNDLVVDDRKLAGLLAEADIAANGDVRAVVVGAGCNVEWSEFPPEIAKTATACNIEAGRPVDRATLLDAFLAELAHRVRDPRAIAPDYRSRLSTLGRSVRVDLGERVLEGTATDVDDAGRLVVTSGSGQETTVAAGDVVHVRSSLSGEKPPR